MSMTNRKDEKKQEDGRRDRALMCVHQPLPATPSTGEVWSVPTWS